MRPVLDDHAPAAVLADDIALLVRDLDAVELALRLVHGLLKVRVEVPHDGLPLDLSVRDAIEQKLHIRRKMNIHDLRELLTHDPVDDLAELGHVEVLLFLRDIAAGDDRRDRRRVGGRTADSELFQRPDQRRLRVVGGRLSVVLLRLEPGQRESGLLRKALRTAAARESLIFLRHIDIHEACAL